jgi:hypothetical protein
MISELLDLIPQNRRIAVVEAMEDLASLFDPQNEAFQQLLKGCRCSVFQGEAEKGFFKFKQ